MPEPVIVPHENMGVAMMHGQTMVSGRAQAMMVHVGMGTANSINGLINAARMNIPMLFTAGRTPLTESGTCRARATTTSTGRRNTSTRARCCASS
jgi:acetolactate synthase-1/2/3 large subunit